MVPRVLSYMPHSSAVVRLTGVLLQALVILCQIVHGSFDYRRLPPSGVAPCTLLLLRATGGGPGVPVLPARSKIKAVRTNVPLMIPTAPFLLAIQASGNHTFIKPKNVRHESTAA